MLLLLQLIALLQYFLPGFLFLRLIKSQWTPLRTLLLSFALSGLFNYAAVLLLYPAGLFTQGSVLLLFGLEVLLLFFTLRPPSAFRIRFGAIDDFFSEMEKTRRVIAAFFFTAAVFVLVFQVCSAVRGFGDLFYSWDSVLSWNRWAVAWFNGTITQQCTLGYPQLVSCNWAMTYRIVGETLNFVPKGTSLLCPFFVSLMLFDLAFTLRLPGLFLAVILNAWFLRNINPLAAGAEADFVIAFYSFTVFYLLFLARETKRKSDLLFAALAAVAAACSKQSGLVVLFLLPALVYASGLLRRREFLRACALYFLLAFVFVVPYYVYFAVQSSRGADRSVYTHVTRAIYGERSRGQLITAASKQFLCKLQAGINSGVPTPKRANVYFGGGVLSGILHFYGKQFWIACGVLLLNILCLRALKAIPFWRGIVWWIVLPYFLVWSAFFCYDLRNLMPFLPLFAAGLSLGFMELTEGKLCRKFLLILLFALLCSVFFLLPEKTIRDFHDTQSARIGQQGLNFHLLPYLKQPGKIATDYQFLDYLPGVRGKMYFVEYTLPDSLKEHTAAMSDPAVRFLLIPRFTAKELNSDVKRRLKNQEIRVLFSAYGYTFYQKTGDR